MIMNSNVLRLTVIALFLSGSLFCLDAFGGQRSSVRIYLPREVTIKDNLIKLSDVGIIRGEEILAAKAGEISLGRITTAGQKVVIDRPMLLSRLACSGIPGTRVTLTGAEEVTVQRQHRIISGSEFEESAQSFLKKNPSRDGVCQMTATKAAKDFIVPASVGEFEVVPRFYNQNSQSHLKIRISVVSQAREIGFQEIVYRLKYYCRRAVAVSDIEQGTVLTKDNVRIEKVISEQPEPADWKAPYGLIAYRKVRANTVLSRNMSGVAKPPIIVKRNQTVVVRVEMPGILATAYGKAMQNGHAGDIIKVKMQISESSQRVIMVKIKENGTVEPVF